MAGNVRHGIRTSPATKIFAARALGNNGENMGNNGKPNVTDNHRNIDSGQEMEYRLNSLRSLVCVLLKTNQELRDALLDAKIDVSRDQGPQSPNTPAIKATR
jgi:hypothetical protein